MKKMFYQNELKNYIEKYLNNKKEIK